MLSLSLLSPLLGILGSLLPSIVRIFERKQEIKYEIDLTKIKLDAAREQAHINFDIEAVKADSLARQSVLDHDKSLDGGKFINALRASIRPVITYTFFALFVAVKVAAAWVMLATGQSVPEMLDAVWDLETMSLFSTIVAFWFGSRVLEKRENREMSIPKITVNTTVSSTPVTKNKK
jgi:hypothetical protein